MGTSPSSGNHNLLCFLTVFESSFAELHIEARGVLYPRNIQNCESPKIRVGIELECEQPALHVKLHSPRHASDTNETRTAETMGGPSSTIDVVSLRLLVAAEHREVLLIPLVTPLICVICSVVPLSAMKQTCIKCPIVLRESSDMSLPCIHWLGLGFRIGPLLIQVVADTELSNQSWSAFGNLSSRVGNCLQLPHKHLFDVASPNDCSSFRNVEACFLHESLCADCGDIPD